jgi:hypothetical protein
MSLFSGDISTAQTDVAKDISQLSTAETQVITTAVAALNTMLRGLVEGYTIEIKAVKK